MKFISKRLAIILCFTTLLSTPTLAADTKSNPYANQKPVPVTMTGYIYTQLAPGTTTNVSWVMFQQEGTNELFTASLLGDTSLYLVTTKKVKVDIIGTRLTTRQWPYNIVNIKTLKGDLKKADEYISGILIKEVDKRGKVFYTLTKKYTKQKFTLVPKKGSKLDLNFYVNKSIWVTGVREDYTIESPYTAGIFDVSGIGFCSSK